MRSPREMAPVAISERKLIDDDVARFVRSLTRLLVDRHDVWSISIHRADTRKRFHTSPRMHKADCVDLDR